MEIKLWGVSYKFTFLFFAVLVIYVILDTEGLGLLVILAMALHEGGHLVMMRHQSVRLVSVEFASYGIRMEKRGILSYNGEIAVYFGGVCANFLGSALCLLVGKWDDFAKINLMLAIFHLLPVGRLDGGVLLRLVLCRAGLGEKVSWICNGVAFVLLFPLFCAAVWMAIRGNYSLLFTAVYLFMAQAAAESAE